MDLQYISFEQAKTLKELGFPQQHIQCAEYTPDGRLFTGGTGFLEGNVNAPLLEIAAKWLREEKNIDIILYKNEECGNISKDYCIDIIYENSRFLCINEELSYNNALFIGIDKALVILTKK